MSYLETPVSLFNPEPTRNSFIQSPVPWLITFSYLMFVKVYGPRLMKDKEPYHLKKLIVTYNVAMIVINMVLGYCFSLVMLEVWPYRCDIKKSPIYTNRGKPIYYFAAWCFLIVKFVELLDTVFFILRKKFGHVSVLHVFHHSIMCSVPVVFCQYDIYSFYHILIGSVNPGIHVILYTYYALCLLRPDTMRKYFWCKKYITTLQIMQFVVYMVYMLYSNLIDCGDGFQSLDTLAFCITIAITVLFINFYFRNYIQMKKKK